MSIACCEHYGHCAVLCFANCIRLGCCAEYMLSKGRSLQARLAIASLQARAVVSSAAAAAHKLSQLWIIR
jgi:hypothetical protein